MQMTAQTQGSRENLLQELQALNEQITERRDLLAACWGEASQADRIMAIRRLMLQRGMFSVEDAEEITSLNDRVYELWLQLRSLRSAPVASEQAMIPEMFDSLAHAESERDAFIEERGLVDLVLGWSETFVQAPGAGLHRPTFRDMLNQQKYVLGQLARLAEREKALLEEPFARARPAVRFLPPVRASNREAAA